MTITYIITNNNYYDEAAINQYKLFNKTKYSSDMNVIPPKNYNFYKKNYMFNEFDFDEYKYDIETYIYYHFYLNNSNSYYDLNTIYYK